MLKYVEALALITLLLLIVAPASVYGLFEYSEVKTATIHAPAVSSGGRGVLSKITLAVAYPGNGRVFFSALPYTEVETQGAARLAAYIASLVAKVEFSNYDYYVLVESSVPLIGGPSAGGLIAVGFTALLLNLTLNGTVTMTGMINPDGSIGPVGGIKEKLEAAASSGFKVFLIPMGQRTYSYPVYEEYRRGPFIIRRARYVSVDLVEYGKSLGVSVVEACSVGEALYYFTGVNVTSSVTVSQSVLNNALNVAISFYADLSNRAKQLLEEAARMAQRLGGYYGYSYSQAISRLNQSLVELSKVLNNYPTYATQLLLSTYKNIVEYYWALQVLTRSITVDQVLDNVNNTISKAVSELYSENYTLENGLIQAFLYGAWLYYSNAVNTTDTSSQLEYASEALKLIELAKLHQELSTWSYTPLGYSAEKLTEMYSHALGVYTYTSRLLEELNVEVNALNQASSYVEVLGYAYESKSPIVYGAGTLVIGYSALAIHTAFGTANTVLGKWVNLLSLYADGNITPLMAYYLRLVEESIVIGDSDTGISAVTLAIALLQTRSTGAGSTVISEPKEYEPCTPTSTTNISEEKTVTPQTMPGLTGTTSTTPQSTEFTSVELLVAFALTLIVIIAFTRIFRQRYLGVGK